MDPVRWRAVLLFPDHLCLLHDGFAGGRRRLPRDAVVGIERVQHARHRIDDGDRHGSVGAILFAAHAAFAIAVDTTRRPLIDVIAVSQRLTGLDQDLGRVRRILHQLLERHTRRLERVDLHFLHPLFRLTFHFVRRGLLRRNDRTGQDDENA